MHKYCMKLHIYNLNINAVAFLNQASQGKDHNFYLFCIESFPF